MWIPAGTHRVGDLFTQKCSLTGKDVKPSIAATSVVGEPEKLPRLTSTKACQNLAAKSFLVDKIDIFDIWELLILGKLLKTLPL